MRPLTIEVNAGAGSPVKAAGSLPSILDSTPARRKPIDLGSQPEICAFQEELHSKAAREIDIHEQFKLAAKKKYATQILKNGQGRRGANQKDAEKKVVKIDDHNESQMDDFALKSSSESESSSLSSSSSELSSEESAQSSQQSTPSQRGSASMMVGEAKRSLISFRRHSLHAAQNLGGSISVPQKKKGSISIFQNLNKSFQTGIMSSKDSPVITVKAAAPALALELNDKRKSRLRSSSIHTARPADAKEPREEKLTVLMSKQRSSSAAGMANSFLKGSRIGAFTQQSAFVNPDRVLEESSKTSGSGSQASQHSAESEGHSSQISNKELVDNRAVHQVTHEMEDYYDGHFNSYAVLTKKKSLQQEKIWRIFFDVTYDMVYNFLAKIEVSRVEADNKKSEVGLTLHLQAWNLDDRIMKDKEHTQAPMWNFEIMRFKEVIDLPFESQSHMMYMQNKYQDFTQPILNGFQIYFFNRRESISNYDARLKIFDHRRMQFRFDQSFKTFKPVIHYKDIKDDHNKNNFSYIKEKQIVEAIAIWSYHSKDRLGQNVLSQRSKVPVKESARGALSNNARTENSEQRLGEADEMKDADHVKKEVLTVQDKYQYLQLYTIPYDQIQDFKTSNSEADIHLNCGAQEFKFKDQRLLEYYDGLDHVSMEKQIMTVQRVENTPIYIVLFPTGLLLHVASILPLTIESKTQLNLKEEETIVDVQYCCSPDNQNHCFWMIDQRHQVWKCYSDRNLKDGNWTLIKVASLERPTLNKFLEPAMTYEEYYINQSIRNMQCIKELLREDNEEEYLIAYNGTATKLVLVKQPKNQRAIHEYDGQPGSGTRQVGESDGQGDRFSEILEKQESSSSASPIQKNDLRFLEDAQQEGQGLAHQNKNINTKELNSVFGTHLALPASSSSFASKQTPLQISQPNAQPLQAHRRPRFMSANEEPAEKLADGAKTGEQPTDKDNAIAIYCVSKDNNVIMNWIPEKQSHLLSENKVELQQRSLTYSKLKKLFTDSDIFELIFLGKCKQKFSDKENLVEYRKFLVRRKLILELMFTNGLSHRTVPILQSQPQAGYLISEIKMQRDQKRFIAVYSNEHVPAHLYYKAFDDDGMQGFKVNEQVQIDKFKNFSFGHDNRERQFVVQIVNAVKKQGLFSGFSGRGQIRMKKEDAITDLLQIPRDIIFGQLLDQNNIMDRLMKTKNGQLLMCGRIVIQLSQDLQQFLDIGVIILQREFSKIKYQFMSLLHDKERTIIKQAMRDDLQSIVKFDLEMQPVSPDDFERMHICYMVNKIDELNNGSTSIIKLNTQTLKAIEIYQSDFIIVHLQIKENEQIKEKAKKIETAMIRRATLKRDSLHSLLRRQSTLKTPYTPVPMPESENKSNSKSKPPQQKESEGEVSSAMPALGKSAIHWKPMENQGLPSGEGAVPHTPPLPVSSGLARGNSEGQNHFASFLEAPSSRFKDVVAVSSSKSPSQNKNMHLIKNRKQSYDWILANAPSEDQLGDHFQNQGDPDSGVKRLASFLDTPLSKLAAPKGLEKRGNQLSNLQLSSASLETKGQRKQSGGEEELSIRPPGQDVIQQIQQRLGAERIPLGLKKHSNNNGQLDRKQSQSNELDSLLLDTPAITIDQGWLRPASVKMEGDGSSETKSINRDFNKTSMRREGDASFELRRKPQGTPSKTSSGLKLGRQQLSCIPESPAETKPVNNRSLQRRIARHSELNVEEMLHQNRNKIQLSLVSQTKKQIKIEVITDSDVILHEKNDGCEHDKSHGFSLQKEMQKIAHNTQTHIHTHTQSDHKHGHAQLVDQSQQHRRAELTMLINVSSKEILITSSEVGWISNTKLILTINNEYHLINMQHRDWIKLENNIQYARQHIDMQMFVSLMRCQKPRDQLQRKNTRKPKKQAGLALEASTRLDLVQSQRSVQLMDIASFARYAFIRKAKYSKEVDRDLLFFIPTEELHGANILQRLSTDLQSIKPFLEKIDSDFVAKMNHNVKNMVKYLDFNYTIGEIHQNITHKCAAIQGGIDKVHGDFKNHVEWEELGFQLHDRIHMFQDDIAGNNPIDIAFQQNSIFCIKAFVDSLLHLTDEISFRNYVDKALLLMISRGLDVKRYVKSDIFFPPIWKKKTIYSKQEDPITRPFNSHMQDLEYLDPVKMFGIEDVFEEDDAGRSDKPTAASWMIIGFLSRAAFKACKKRQPLVKEELYEMEYRYVNMAEIQGSDKMSISQTLKNAKDLELFEQESIQLIIDYKWETYTARFFRCKFIVYVIYMISFYWSCQEMTTRREGASQDHVGEANSQGQMPQSPTPSRGYLLQSAIGLIIQFMFFIYELLQANTEGRGYWQDGWNYLELLEPVIYCIGFGLKEHNEYVTDGIKLCFCISIFLSLMKFLNLVRCFRQLSFLVMMIEQVVLEVWSFIILFIICLLPFAQAYGLLAVDTSVYPRFPNFIGQALNTFRASMGDFALIDPWQTFDLYNRDEFERCRALQQNCIKAYKHSMILVVFTWITFCAGQIILFMIFMNFIIAVITDSFNTINKRKISYDYLARAKMIFEREAHFSGPDFLNDIYFPKILVLQKIKPVDERDDEEVGHEEKELDALQDFMKEQEQHCQMHFSKESKVQKDMYSNKLHTIENEIASINHDLEKIQQQIANVQMVQSKDVKQILRSPKSAAPSSPKTEVRSQESDHHEIEHQNGAPEKAQKQRDRPQKSTNRFSHFAHGNRRLAKISERSYLTKVSELSHAQNSDCESPSNRHPASPSNLMRIESNPSPKLGGSAANGRRPPMNADKSSHNVRSSPSRAENDKILGHPASQKAGCELAPIAESTKDLGTAKTTVADEHKVEADEASNRQKIAPKRRKKKSKKDNKLQLQIRREYQDIKQQLNSIVEMQRVIMENQWNASTRRHKVDQATSEESCQFILQADNTFLKQQVQQRRGRGQLNHRMGCTKEKIDEENLESSIPSNGDVGEEAELRRHVPNEERNISRIDPLGRGSTPEFNTSELATSTMSQQYPPAVMKRGRAQASQSSKGARSSSQLSKPGGPPTRAPPGSNMDLHQLIANLRRGEKSRGAKSEYRI